MSGINNNLLNNSKNDYNIFLLIKKHMVNGELTINDLSSKNRALLHRICATYGLDHYSTGNYNNRIFVIKDKQHTYFTNTTNEDYWEAYLTNELDNNNNNIAELYNFSNTNNLKSDNDSDYLDEDDENDENDEEDVVEEKDTDTYSSNSDSSDSVSNSECTNIYLMNKINNHEQLLKYIYILSLSNLIATTYLMFTI
jgi:hypothetical protein